MSTFIFLEVINICAVSHSSNIQIKRKFRQFPRGNTQYNFTKFELEFTKPTLNFNLMPLRMITNHSVECYKSLYVHEFALLQAPEGKPTTEAG